MMRADLRVGFGQADLTPPIGTPSAGYVERKGAGMEGIHDPLQALVFLIDNGEKKIALCGVDHLGFSYEMVKEIEQIVCQEKDLEKCEIYIGSSHTHSGGGAYLKIPGIGEKIAGRYDPQIAQFYIQQTAKAIIEASQSMVPSKIGIGYGRAKNLSFYRASWPLGVQPIEDLFVIKVTHLDGTPWGVFFNYPIHPTVFRSQNRFFSADLVGFARESLSPLRSVYFNGAQGDINPVIFQDQDRHTSCRLTGEALAKAVTEMLDQIEVQDQLEISSYKKSYLFQPKETPFGFLPQMGNYQTELNLIVFNQTHAVITIPGELSTLYAERLKEKGKSLGFENVSIFGLTNDAHGYIILPEAWEKKTQESGLSFGGKDYGTEVERIAESLLTQSIK